MVTSTSKHGGRRLLVLFRHGKAVGKDLGLNDFDRCLTSAGRRECAQVAAHLATREPRFDRLLSSPADRALETAHIAAPCFKISPLQIQTVSILYDSDMPAPIVATITRLPSTLRRIMLFGHNPSFDALAAYFIPDFTTTIPKGGALGITFDVTSWQNLDRRSGRFAFMVRPLKKGGNGYAAGER